MCESEFSLEDRVLCMDGNCIGVVGSDGKCKVCGLVYEGDDALPSEAVSLSEAMSEDVPVPISDTNLDIEPDFELEERVCCSDDSCIGIIGPDGRCGTCGKVSEN